MPENSNDKTWGTREMLKHAFATYHPNMDKNLKQYLSDGFIKQIKRTINDLGLPRTPLTPEELDKEDVPANQPYRIPINIAKCIIEQEMYTYFIKGPRERENYLKEMDAKHQKFLKKVRKESAIQDEVLNKAYSEMFETFYNPEFSLAQLPDDEFEDLKREQPTLAKFDDKRVNPDYYKYHITAYPRSEMPLSYADEVIDRMMIRALFNKFFEFKEEEFRQDLLELSTQIDDDPNMPTRFKDGFSALLYSLEHPEGYYYWEKTEK